MSSLGKILVESPKHLHLIGVAGSGMSGIAALLLSLGHKVSGCDLVSSSEVKRLEKLGLIFHTPQAAHYLEDAEIVIYSSAIKTGNPVYDEAKRAGLPMFRRAEALAAIMSLKKGIIVSGMHGKTTVSSMAAHVLRFSGIKPSHYVGAEIPVLGTNAHWEPDGAHFVAEGDESDGTLALYHPAYSIVLNIEPEHLDHYKDLNAIDATFRRLLNQTSGKVIYSADDPGAVRVCADHRNAISFGEAADADCRLIRAEARGMQSIFEVSCKGETSSGIILNIPGKHNVSNALAVIALAIELGIPMESIVEALATFRGARRRFEEKYRSSRFLVIDDYGHHPTEVAATLSTARALKPKRLMVAFQPHRFSRTKLLRSEFGKAFHAADHVFVADIYPASEQPIEGITGKSIVDAMQEDGFEGHAEFLPGIRKIAQSAARQLEPGDLFITLGAGNIHEASKAMAADLTIYEELCEMLPANHIRLYEPLAKHTTLRVGGPARFWIEPETYEGFAKLARYCRTTGLPLMVMGRGSNLLVRDGGIPGVVVHLARGEFTQLTVQGLTIRAGVGVKLKQLAYAARDAEIGGFEWFEGIPGNVGGGLRMNAGAMGSQTFDQVTELTYLDENGLVHTTTPDQIAILYRSVPWLEKNIALAATFSGMPSTREKIEALLDESMLKRRKSQPAAASAGCIFKNPASIPAGKLIDELGLKNAAVGRARVSEVHGNFIVNDGGATAAEVLALIDVIRSRAIADRGIHLETEVQIVGENS